MKQKIEWYREVLELEPGSRVFFPLARLLASDGQLHEAIVTLRQGVVRHPDHVEARLYLVELLAEQGSTSELTIEVEHLGALFAGYPGFWKAWSRVLSSNPAMQDAALAMIFFSAALQGRPVTWASIIEHGLQSMLEAGPAVRQPEQTAAPSITVAHSPVPAAYPSQPDDEEEDPNEEAFSLRTRSMAEVLAEQGDILGALDIYNELIGCADDREKSSLEARANELSRQMGNAPAQPLEDQTEGGEGSGKDGNRLIGLLESLAERLEARSR